LCDEVLRDVWRRVAQELRPILARGIGVEAMFAALLGALTSIEARDGRMLSAMSAAILSQQSTGAAAVNDTLLPLVDEIEAGLRAAEPGRIHPDAPLRDVIVYVQLARAAGYRLQQLVGDEVAIDTAHELFIVDAMFRAVLEWNPPQRRARSAAKRRPVSTTSGARATAAR
jgi:hypothetical protein